MEKGQSDMKTYTIRNTIVHVRLHHGKYQPKTFALHVILKFHFTLIHNGC